MSCASKLFCPAVAGCAWVPRRQAREHYRWLRLARRVASCCAYGGVIYQEITVHAVEITGRVSDAGFPPSYLSWLVLTKLYGRGSSPAAQSHSPMCHGPKFATTGRPTSATQQSSTGRLGNRVWLACVISTTTSLPKRSTAACASLQDKLPGPVAHIRQYTDCNSLNPSLQLFVGWLAYPRRIEPYGTRRGSASDLTLNVPVRRHDMRATVHWRVAPGNPSVRWLKRAGVHNLCVRACP